MNRRLGIGIILGVVTWVAIVHLIQNHDNHIYYQILSFVLYFIILNLLIARISSLSTLLKQANKTDPLTGCMLPSYFKFIVEQAALLQHRYKTQSTSLILKLNNDFQTNHDSEVWLKEVAQICLSRVRQTDTICRYSDTRFIVLLPNTDKDNAEKLATDLVSACDAYEFSYLKKQARQENAVQFELSCSDSMDKWETWYRHMTR